MRVCSEVVPFEELRFLAVTDELIAEAWRNRPATLVKKSYARFDSFERLVALPSGLAQSTPFPLPPCRIKRLVFFHGGQN